MNRARWHSDAPLALGRWYQGLLHPGVYTIRASAPADRLAAVLAAAVDGLQVRSRIDLDRSDVDAAVSTLVDLL